MRTYPKFLKNTPRFFGLDFMDLGILMMSLFIAMIFNLPPISALIMGALAIGSFKIIRKTCDLTALFLPRKYEVIVLNLKKEDNHERF